MTAYYNEFDPYAAQWLRNLIANNLIAPGDVDERSIKEVKPDDLRGYTQCHFFAGIGVWSYALRLAGWSDDRHVWTGSCPCQPFSSAGKQAGTADERHLWPVWFNLIRECRPDVVFGEQVEAAIGHGWLDLVQSDLEGEGYACGAVGLPACGVGAPHIRQRLWFVADAFGFEREREPNLGPTRVFGEDVQPTQRGDGFGDLRAASGQLADANDTRPQGWELLPERAGERAVGQSSVAGRMAHTSSTGSLSGSLGGVHSGQESAGARDVQSERRGEASRPSPTNGHWRAADWLHCRDGKWRPVEPGTFPLAHGASARVGRLRAYGNAIVPQVAEAFIRAYCEGN